MKDIDTTSFTDWLNKNQDSNNIFPPGMDSDTAIQFLADYLLPKDWYISYSCGKSQANTEIVSAILKKYSKKYRKELKPYL